MALVVETHRSEACQEQETTDSLETLAVSGCDEKVGRRTTAGLPEVHHSNGIGKRAVNGWAMGCHVRHEEKVPTGGRV